MFNKYLRYYPWWMQLLLLLLMLLILGNFVLVLSSLLFPKISGFTVEQLLNLNKDSTGAIVRASLFLQGFSHLSTFLVPSLLFAYLAHPKPAHYLGLKPPANKFHLLLVILLAIGAIPVFMELLSVMHHVRLGSAADAMQAKIENAQGPYLNMNSSSDFTAVLIVMALLPALGEEMLFRGILMRFAKKRSKGIVFPILITSLLFALIHFAPYGLVPIFLAGVLLGYIYYLTGSLLCSMLFHFVNNGLQIALEYFGKSNNAVKTIMDSNSLPLYLPLSGAVIVIIALYLLVKTKTPLPPGWEQDFSPAELENENPNGQQNNLENH